MPYENYVPEAEQSEPTPYHEYTPWENTNAFGDMWDWVVTGMGGGEGYQPKDYDYDERRYKQHRINDARSRQFQNYLANRYQDQIEGRAPSLAQNQLRETTAQNQQQQMAMARSGGGGPLGSAGAQYEAARNAAGTNQMANRQAATLRAQEQNMAMQGASSLGGQMRSQDQSMLANEQNYQLGKGSNWNTQESNKATQAEALAGRRAGASQFGVGAMAAAIGGMAMSDVRAKTAPSEMGPNTAMAPEPEFQTALMQQQQPVVYQPTQVAIPVQQQQQPMQMTDPGQSGQNGMALGAMLGALSDRTAKSGPQPVSDSDLDAFLEDLEGYRYRYKHGVGEDPNRDRVGVMAQDLERDPVGASFVAQGDDGYKRLEVDKGFGTALAAMGRMNERLDALERGRR